MKSKNILFLILILLITLLSSCNEKEKSSEQVAFIIKLPLLTMISTVDNSIATSEDFINKAWKAFIAQYKKYSVDASIIGFKQENFDSAIDDCFDTNNAADLVYGDLHALSSYIHTGRLIPLDSIISNELRQDIFPVFWNASQAKNGKVYCLPFLSRPNIMAYHKQIFRDCGLSQFISEEQKVQSWSMEEWDSILKSLRDKLPQNSYPMMMYANSYIGDLHIMIQLRCKGSNFFDEKGLFHLSTPEGVAALQWIKNNYDKKYYPDHAENLTIGDCSELFANKQLAISFWNIGLLNYYKEQPYNLIPFKDYGFVNFPSQNPHGASTAFISGFFIFDNGNSKQIEIAKDFVQFILQNPQWADYALGAIPCMKSVSDRHPNIDPLTKMLIENAGAIVDYQNNSPNWLSVRNAFYPHIAALLTGEETPEQAAHGLDKDCNLAISKGYQENNLHK